MTWPSSIAEAEPAVQLALFAAGGFFLVGLITGVWKYRWMWRTEEAQAPYYVDTAHRASLLYSFACVLILVFAWFSVWPDVVNLAAVAVLVFFFAGAVASYVLHGVLGDTDNQFRDAYVVGSLDLPPWTLRLAMWALIAGEILGFLVLFAGVTVDYL